MKKFLIPIIFSLGFLSFNLFNAHTVLLLQSCQIQSDSHKIIDYEWEGTSEMQVVHDLFLNSFLHNYRNLTNAELGTDDITKVLNAYWDSELESHETDPIRWIVAKHQGEIVGYASFNMKKTPEDIDVQLLCVKPEYQGLGIGKNLIFSILQTDDKIRKLSLFTRRVNTTAIAFYKKLGFVECDVVDKKTNIDKKLCVQFEKIILR